MNIELSTEQHAKLEQIARNAGKSADQMLVEAAQFLIDFAGKLQPAQNGGSQTFLPEKDLEERLASILHR